MGTVTTAIELITVVSYLATAFYMFIASKRGTNGLSRAIGFLCVAQGLQHIEGLRTLFNFGQVTPTTFAIAHIIILITMAYVYFEARQAVRK